MTQSTARATIVHIRDADVFSRGNGVETTLLIGKENAGSRFTSGLTKFPAGSAAPIHFHNCDEQVTVIEGAAEAEIDGVRSVLGPRDTTFIPRGQPHRFTNIGSEPLVILWIYDIDHVTRTFVETGKTVEHLSAGDKVTRQSDGVTAAAR